jgi:hypothetical protein
VKGYRGRSKEGIGEKVGRPLLECTEKKDKDKIFIWELRLHLSPSITVFDLNRCSFWFIVLYNAIFQKNM